MSMVIGESLAEVWERTVQPDQADLPPEAARYFLKLQFTEADRERMNTLAAKARAATLAQEEEMELANYMQLGWFIDLVKSKARLSLGLAAALEDLVCRRARFRCEYCLLPEALVSTPFQFDHIIAQSHGMADKLGYSCGGSGGDLHAAALPVGFV